MNAMRTAGMVLVGSIALCGLLVGGCSEPTQRLNSPPQGQTAHPAELQGSYTAMTDNALLADMSMSPSDFVPHQAELNSKGVRRLARYADILKTYGGTLNYDGVNDPDKLAKERIKHIEEFLVAAGLEKDKFSVKQGVAGGEGMSATESMADRAASAGPDGKAGGGGLSDTAALNGGGAKPAAPQPAAGK